MNFNPDFYCLEFNKLFIYSKKKIIPGYITGGILKCLSFLKS